MTTRPELIAMRDRLTAARYSGTLKVKTGDDEVTYRSDAELKAAIDALDILIARMDGATPVRQVRIVSSKGL